MKEGAYLITPEERDSFEKNCEMLNIQIIEISILDVNFDKATFRYESARDLIRLGTFMTIDKNFLI